MLNKIYNKSELKMNKLENNAEKIYEEMNNIEMLLTCLRQGIDLCSRDNIEDCTHLLILAEIVSNKYGKLICEYEKFALQCEKI
ncbi:hypothetical protein J6I39_01930 [bacterium]|nr:hypothetical protein [bacterium]